MSKKRIRKALWGMPFSSSPLTSLNPTYSANQGLNFNSTFQQYLQLPVNIQERWDQMGRDFDTRTFNMGANLYTSSDPTVRPLGEQLVQNGMNQLSQSPSSDFNQQDDFNAAGQAIGNIPGQARKIGQQVVGAAGSIKNAWSNLSEINALQKAGVEGLGKAKAGNIAAIAGAVADVASSFLPEKTEYSGDKGGITQTMDTVYDSVSDVAMSFGPVGMMVGGIMKGGKLLGGVMNSIGGGTDGMTTTDAILGSSFLNLTPLGLINGFGGQKAETITKDDLAFEQVGSSYTGTGRSVDDALQKSGKKYGLFSSGARKEANEEILEARRQQDIMSDIASNAMDRFSIRNSMAAINGNRRRFHMQGGYDQSAIRVGRNGLAIQDLQRAKRINSATKYQKGGKVTDPFELYLQTLPENQRDSSQFRVKDYWEFNGKPKNFDEAVFRGMFTQFEDSWHANSVAKNPKTGEIEFMKSSSHPSIQNELDWYESDDASEFRSQYELQKTEPYFKYVKRKADSTQSFKEGGALTKSDWLVEIDINNLPLEFRVTNIEEVDVDSLLPEFKEGGKFNLIPEGALHARKHNMDVEGITPKGIPVVSHSEDGEMEQQAEIERNEVILRLEVTKKLEKLQKDYYNDAYTQKQKDEFAIEAGKLLAYELLENTVDNTGLLNEV